MPSLQPGQQKSFTEEAIKNLGFASYRTETKLHLSPPPSQRVNSLPTPLHAVYCVDTTSRMCVTISVDDQVSSFEKLSQTKHKSLDTSVSPTSSGNPYQSLA